MTKTKAPEFHIVEANGKLGGFIDDYIQLDRETWTEEERTKTHKQWKRFLAKPSRFELIAKSGNGEICGYCIYDYVDKVGGVHRYNAILGYQWEILDLFVIHLIEKQKYTRRVKIRWIESEQEGYARPKSWMERYPGHVKAVSLVRDYWDSGEDGVIMEWSKYPLTKKAA